MTNRALLALMWVAAAAVPAAHAGVVVPPGFADQQIVGGLDMPTSFAILPDGRLLLSELRTGRVRMIVRGHVALADPLLTVPDLSTAGLRGMIAMTVDPGWPARPFVYLYYNRVVAGIPAVRLVRYTAGGALSDPSGESITLSQPLLIMDDLPDGYEHNGGGLRFGPAGYLFVSTGQAGDFCHVQDSTRLEGKLLRLTVASLPSGGGGPVPRALITPPDNPLSSPDSNARLLWARGFHNAWRIYPDEATGMLYVPDPAETEPEEINEVLEGDNLGWPWRAGPSAVFDQPRCPEPGGPGSNWFKPPIYSFRAPNPGLTAVSCAGVYRPVAGADCNWPADYDGNLFVGEFYRGFLRRLEHSSGSWQIAPPVPGQPNPTDWGTGLVAALEFQIASDGSLWWLAMSDSGGSAASGSLHRLGVCPAVDVTPAVVAHMALACTPNPFHGSTEVHFVLARSEHVRLAVYDLSGRRLRTLIDGVPTAGEVLRAWDGRDSRGRLVPPGSYLVRLEHGGAVEAVRVSRLR